MSGGQPPARKLAPPPHPAESRDRHPVDDADRRADEAPSTARTDSDLPRTTPRSPTASLRAGVGTSTSWVDTQALSRAKRGSERDRELRQATGKGA